MTEKLKPCPFCGTKPILKDHIVMGGLLRHFGVFCVGCPACICNFETEAEAAKAWNMRAERTCRNNADDELCDFFCSECGYCYDIEDPNYCPNCGAEVER